MPDLFRYPVLFWIAQKLHCVSRLRANDNPRVFSHRSNIFQIQADTLEPEYDTC